MVLNEAAANKHILERNLSEPNPVFDANGIFQDTINYDRLYIPEEQSTFDKNLREQLFLQAIIQVLNLLILILTTHRLIR